MLDRAWTVGGILCIAQATAQFSLYPSVDPTRLSTALNIGSGCLAALNTTVNCDQTLLTMAGTGCLYTAQSWFNNVYGNCSNDTLTFMGRQVPPYTIPGRTLDGLKIACLTPTTNVSMDAGVAASVLTLSDEPNTTTTARSLEDRQSTSSGFCLFDSYNWVGSDIIRPDCTLASNQNNGQCIDPTNVTDYNQRIVNLYPNSLLCSTCFVNMYYLRVASPYLPDLDYSDYLVQQYYDIIEVCNNTQMPDLLVRLTPDSADAPGYFKGQPANNTLQPFIGGSSALTLNATANGTIRRGGGREEPRHYIVLRLPLDIDFEYPGAMDRGGVPADTANFVALTKELRAAFGSKYGLTVPIPTSYWYLQHFDLVGIQANIDWFNLMAYDLHGTWDSQSKFVGPYIAPHTNITEIDTAFDLLWRAGVDSHKVVMGQGWYGHSFTLKDPSCSTPNGVCQFSGGANPGPCSKASGILDYQEIANIITQNKLNPTRDKIAGVKWINWNSNQWVSYDDGDTFKQKRDFANSRCLGGLMVWAMDQVDQTAANGFGGSAAAVGAGVSSTQQASANQMSLDTLAGLKCYTSDCNAGCKAGTTEAAEFNGQPGQLSTNGRCAKKTYRSLCCDAKTQTGTCQWRGYRGAGLACIKGCAQGETELTTSTNQHVVKKGDKDCHGGLQSFCCSNFKPSTSSLEDDLKDAAKAAAEAAAEQAALDIAAKAFCLIAVPALPDPIFGEIADLVEIAATPAIIQGCVKGIEKEGKAEFKVFGKTHSLLLNSPATKATSVPDRPPAKGDNPSKTGDKNDKCQSKAKGALPPVETTYVNTPRMDRLTASCKRGCKYDWKNGDGYALLLMYPRQYTLDLIPKHYGIVAGYVSCSLGKVQDEKDACGNVVRRTQQVMRDWRSNGYDQVLNPDGSMAQGGPEVPGVPDPVEVPRIGAQGMAWTGSSFDKFYIVWSDLGPIRPSLAYADVVKRGDDYIKAHPNYSTFFNNCYHFATSLYAWMVDPLTPLRMREDLGEVVDVEGRVRFESLGPEEEKTVVRAVTVEEGGDGETAEIAAGVA